MNTFINKTLALLAALLIMAGSLQAQTYSGGSGTSASPYQIANTTDLIYLSQHSGDWDKYFIQTANIAFNADETQVDWDGDGSATWDAGDQLGFSPIGNATTKYTGSYNGQSHTINYIFINRSSDNIGVFGWIGISTASGAISNLGVINAQITGASYVGGVAGNMAYYSSLTNCYTTGAVTGTGSRIGGLIGEVTYNSGVDRCYSLATLNGGDDVGGLVGMLSISSHIYNSYARGSVTGSSNVGGLLGYGTSTPITDKCFSTGAVSGSSNIGGFAGNYVGTTIGNSFWNVETDGIDGNITGANNYGATGKTTAQLQDYFTFTSTSTYGLNSAWDMVTNPNDDSGNNDYWDMDQAGSINNGYPILSWQPGADDIIGLPTITTTSVTSVTASTASSGGTVINVAGTVSARGVCWSTSSSPTTSDSKTSNGTGGGSFSSSVTGLSGNTSYYLRAYATNEVGTSYGSEDTFTTPNGIPTVTTTAVTSITNTTAQSGGNVTNDGGATITARGVCWNTTGTPTTADQTATNAPSTGSYISSVTGLTAGTTYYLRAFASNSYGTAYGTQVSFTTTTYNGPVLTTQAVDAIQATTATAHGTITDLGSNGIVQHGVCYGTSENPTTSGAHTFLGSTSSTGSFDSPLAGLSSGTTYYVRAYAISGASETGYGEQVSFTTAVATVPLVTTQAMTSVTETTATGNGTITGLGNGSVTQHGVCWSTNTNPDITDNITEEGSASATGSYTSSLTGLSSGITYYLRAYATNSIGTGYGDQISFTTLVPSNTKYVNSSSGSDVTGDGTEDNPYATFTYAYDQVPDGGTIHLSGTFDWNVSETGDAAYYGFTIAKNLSIIGEGADLTIIQAKSSANSADRRVFTISSGYTVTLEGLTIRYGKTGNYGGGIHNNGGTVYINYCGINYNYSINYGGGILNQGTMTIVGSTINNNSIGTYSVNGGGGISNYSATGPLVMTNTTISNNQSTDARGAGIFHDSDYPAILTNCTVSRNSNTTNLGYAGHGGIETRDSIYITNCYVVDNYTYGVWDDYYGFFRKDYTQYSILGKVTTCNAVNGVNGNIVNQYAGNYSYISSTLAANSTTKGTMTLAITSASSWAIDAGTTTSNHGVTIPNIDQRGMARSTVDIGAFEYNGSLPELSTIYVNANAGSDLSGDGSSSSPFKTFNKAYTLAADPATLYLTGTFDWSSSAETGDATTTGYTLAKNLTITGQGAGSTFIQAASSAGTADRRVFTIADAYAVNFNDLTIRYGNVGANGGGIKIGGDAYDAGVAADLTLTNCTLSNNAVTTGGTMGGGLFANLSSPGTVTITNSTISDNDVDGATTEYGGGLYLYHGSSTITGTTINGNTSAGHGGGIYTSYHSLDMTNSTIEGNTSAGSGSAIAMIYTGTNTLQFNTICNNITSNASAGALEPSTGVTLVLQNNLLGNNSGGYDFVKTNTPVITDNGYNIVETSSAFTFNASGDITGNQSNLFGTGVASQSLADNGGDTYTLAIGAGSVAIGAGSYNSSVTTDQRGDSRFNPPTIGAFAYQGSGSAITWTGATDSDWATASNWSSSVVPGGFDNVTIADVSNPPVIGSGTGASCNNLTINSGAYLNVSNGGSLINNGTLTNNGTMLVSKTISEDTWHLISMPVTSGTAALFEGDYLQYWTESTGAWSDITETTEALSPGQGYGLWGMAKTTHNYTFEGTANTGNVSKGISHTEVAGTGYDGANLLGNPYPSSINWDEVSGYGAAYMWNGSAYVAWTSDQTGSGFGTADNGYIPPMQGFFIVVPDNDPATFTFTNSMRTHAGATGFYKSSNALPDGILLYADNGNYHDKLLIRFNDQASANMDQDYDAWKFPSNTPGLAQLWSKATEGNLSIDVRPWQERIQLGFSNDVAGTYHIGIDQIAQISSAVLEDTRENSFHDLTKGDYTFDWQLTDDEDRFVLHLGPTGVEEQAATEEQLLIYSADRTLHLKSLTGAQTGTLTITDMSGHRVYQSTMTINSHTMLQTGLTSGVYVVRFITDVNSKVKKVIIH